MARKRSPNTGEETIEPAPLEQPAVVRPEIDLKPTSKRIELTPSSQSPANTVLDVTATPLEDATGDSMAAKPEATAKLEAMIAELKSALETAQRDAAQREQDLLQEIATLTDDIQTQQDHTTRLQTELDKADALKTELKAQLEEARKVILQLSQVNAKPAPPIATPKVQAAEPELETSRPAAIQPVQPAQRRPELDRKQHQVALKRILDHPTQPGRLPSMPSDSTESGSTGRGSKPEMDMGWVD